MNEAKKQKIVKAIEELKEKAIRAYWTAAKIDYCRHMDSPEWRREVEDILERHPEWK